MKTQLKIANAPCSWGALEFDLDGKAAGYAQVLDEMRATGYDGTELGDWGFMPTEPGALQQVLQQRSLHLLGAFVPVALAHPKAHAEGEARAIATARLMKEAGFANAFIVLADENGSVPQRTLHAGRILPAHSLPEASMQIFGAGANRIAEAVYETLGMRTVFHHHCAGYIETPAEIEYLLEITDPNLLGLCFDTGHYMYGGGRDAAAFLQKHYSRIWHVHFKDYSPEVAKKATDEGWDYFQSVANGVFCELGKGAVDFAAVVEVLNAKGYSEWIVVEQDVLPGMGNPMQCAYNNRKYLQTLGL